MTDRNYFRYPIRHCIKCGHDLAPRPRKNGSMETPKEYRARMFCRSCYKAGNRGQYGKGTAAIASENQMHNRLMANWRLVK